MSHRAEDWDLMRIGISKRCQITTGCIRTYTVRERIRTTQGNHHPLPTRMTLLHQDSEQVCRIMSVGEPARTAYTHIKEVYLRLRYDRAGLSACIG